MLPRLAAALSSRLPSGFSFALFSSTASSSSPSAAQQHKMSVKELVETAISGNKVVIFSKSYCPYCKKVKSLFEKEFPDVTPAVFELDERDDGSTIQEYLHQKTGQRTVPNVFINEQHIGGNDDTQAAFKAGKLAGLIKA